MFLTLPPSTVFYRVTPQNRLWREVLTGLGAFFGERQFGRYHRPMQRVVYTADDPLVVLTEAAFHAAQAFHYDIGTATVPRQHATPKVTRKLWAFRLTPPPTVIDLEDPIALHVFGHPPYVLRNPTSTHYGRTQDLMNAAFSHPANALGQKAWGVKAPSVRSPVVPGYRPAQFIFTLQPRQNRLPAQLVDCWNVTFEFLDDAQQPVTAQTAFIDWQRPRFRLKSPPKRSTGPIPAYTPRPGAVPFQLGPWYPIAVVYA
jgi:hypothetical protein